MANTRTRASTRKSGKDANLVGQARHAAEGAVKDLQKRLKPLIRKTQSARRFKADATKRSMIARRRWYFPGRALKIPSSLT